MEFPYTWPEFCVLSPLLTKHSDSELYLGQVQHAARYWTGTLFCQVQNLDVRNEPISVIVEFGLNINRIQAGQGLCFRPDRGCNAG